ncbi:MAG: CopD family protein [Betaproteobacteria bacterium]
MLIVKTLHIVFMVSWFAGLFYLPRLFVYHANATDTIGIDRFKVMERRLLRGIMMPSMLATIVFGSWLWLGYGISGGWLHAKLALVAILIVYQGWLARTVRAFAEDRNTHSAYFYRWINEIPALPILVAIVYLVVAKPF